MFMQIPLQPLFVQSAWGTDSNYPSPSREVKEMNPAFPLLPHLFFGKINVKL
jgi:hypothetical protein